MPMVVYVDLLFLKDFGMTFFILLLVSEVLSIKINLIRLLFSCGITSILTVYLVLYDMEQSFWCKVLLAMLMAKLAFNSKNFEGLFRQSGALFILSFVVGGISYSSFQKWYECLLLGFLFWLALYQCEKYYRTSKWIARNTYEIVFELFDHTVQLQAFLDTGNFLTSGIKEEPVMIVSLESVKDCIPLSILSLLIKEKSQNGSAKMMKDLCLVKYQAFDEKEKETYGLRIKNVVIKNDSQTKRINAVMIISHHKYQNFDALIGLSALEGGFADGNLVTAKAKGTEILC